MKEKIINKLKNKKLLITLGMMLLVLGIGSTIAYFTSTDIFPNIFNTATCNMQSIEKFESPNNWTPGTTTEKKVTIKSDCEACMNVRVSYTEKWEDKDGNSLPLIKDGKRLAIINFDNTEDWEKKGNYYYYKNNLNKTEETSSFIKSVTFNPEVTLNTTCREEGNQRICENGNGVYGGAKYTLTIKIETMQCEGKEDLWKTGMLMEHNNDATKTFGKNIARSSFESITTVDSKTVPSNAIDSWDASAGQNGTVIAWYLDEDNDDKYELYIGQDGGVIANTNSSFAFSYFSNITSIDLSKLNTSNATNMRGIFAVCSSLPTIDVGNFDTSNVTNMRSMFSGCTNLTTINGLNNWDTSKVTTMRAMFQRCTSLTSIDVSNFDTSNVTDMSYMFTSCINLEEIDLSNWSTPKLTNMGSMFCMWNDDGSPRLDSKLKRIKLSNKFDTSKVTNMYALFANNTLIEDYSFLQYIDTSSVTDIKQMFQHNRNLNGTFTIKSNPTSYQYAFAGAATNPGTNFVVNYSSATTNIDAIIATKSSNSNVVKGSQID